MKKRTVLITLGLVLAAFVAGLLVGKVDLGKIAPDTYKHTDITSTVPKDECFLCGEGETCLGHSSLRPNNLGILDLNTFEVHYIEINRYENGGVLSTASTGVLAVSGMDAETGYVKCWLDADRGYCHVDITDVKYELEADSIQQRLCQDCIEVLNTDLRWGGNPTGFAVVNYKDRTIQPLVSNAPAFGMGDYLVECQFRDSGDVRLLIALLPNRFPVTEEVFE